MKSNDFHPTNRPDMSLDPNIIPGRVKAGRRSTSSVWIWIIILIVAFLYAISPIDFIPDFLPVLGWIDDAAVLLTAILIAVPKLVKSYKN